MQSLDDGLFGPQLPGRFDFTLAFEHGILSIPPSVLFLFAAGYRLRTLIPGRSRRVSDHEGSTSGIPHGGGGGALYWSKTVCLPPSFCQRTARVAYPGDLYLIFSLSMR